MDSGCFILGPQGENFEREFARALGVRHAVGLSSGTEALILALKALKIGPGDEVIIPAFTFIASASAVAAVGAKPVFADIDPRTLTLDPASARRAVTRRTKALMPVHLYGQPADMTGLAALAREKALKIVEDCAQSHLSRWRGKPVGAMGDIAAFSFYPSKNLGAFGDAGAITTQDKRLDALCRELRNAGRKQGSWYDYARLGANSRLDEMQAAVLRVKLKKLKAWTSQRRQAAALYARELSGLPLELPDPGRNGTTHTFHLFVVRLEERDALSKHLAAAGIASAVYYPSPLHLLTAFSGLGYKRGDLPVSERAAKTVLALPLYPGLTALEIKSVAKAARDFFKK